MPEVAEQQRGGAPAPAPPQTPEQPEKKGGLPSALKWTIALVVVIALVVGGLMYWSYASVRESTDDAQIDGHIYPVSAMIDGTHFRCAHRKQPVRPGRRRAWPHRPALLPGRSR